VSGAPEENDMTDSDKPLAGEQARNGTPSPYSDPAPDNSGEAGRVVLVAILGGLVSAAGYLVYRRLPDEQRDRLHSQVRGALENRLNEIRATLNI
jgi:hypothetical protein